MKSQAIVCALVVLCSALSVNSSPSESYIPSKADQSLIEYMMKPRQADGLDLPADVASNLIPCFNYYLPILNSIADTFQKDTKACDVTFNKQLIALNEERDKVRTNITGLVINVSNVLSNCESKNDTLESFDCFANSGDHTVRQVYTISEHASAGAANYRETLIAITIAAENCAEETRGVYSVDTEKVHKELDDCLTNGLKATTTV